MVELKKFTPFAIFKPSEESVSRKPEFRIETYLSLIKKKEDFIQSLQNKKCKCIGIVIMLNPGSSEPEKSESSWINGKIVEAEVDPTMKQIEKCVKMAYEIKKKELEGAKYIEIFNLFELCCTSSKEVIKKYKMKDESLIKSKIKIEEIDIPETPCIWIAWGCDKEINDIKEKVYDTIISQFPENIIIKFHKNIKNKYEFWHPFQHDKHKQSELIDEISKEISNKIIQQN